MSDDAVGGDAGCEEAKCSEITLPDDSLVLVRWKVKPGSLVTKGETIAFAGPKGTESSDDSTSASSTPAVPGHKRPNRRRRIAPVTSRTAVPAPLPASKPAGNSSNPIASIQQRLAEKLSSEKDASPSKEDTNKESSAPAETTGNSSNAKQQSEHPVLAPATGVLRLASNKDSLSVTTSSSPRVIGYVDECSHPAFLQGVCVVCGKAIHREGGDDDEEFEGGSRSQNANVPFPSSETVKHGKASRVTVSGGITMTVSAEESKNMAQRDMERLLQQAKLSLVLDLDHTLVHATADPRARQFHGRDDVRILRLPMMEGLPNSSPASHSQGQMFVQHHVKLRPHIKTFLQSVQPDFELTVYTAGTRQYAEEITIVLCRHMVGSNRDIDDLEELRYQFHAAEMEYRRVLSLKEKHHYHTNVDNGKRNKQHNWPDENDDMDAEQPSKKRKKVSFGVPEEEISASVDVSETKPPARKDHMTKEKLDFLKKEMDEADELEKQAWELRKKLFGSRVVSRTDVGDLGRDVKSLKRIFPCGGTMAAVVDDREDVWANAVDNSDETIKGEPPDNLLLVRPYHWQPFIGFADINNAAGEDLSGTHPNNGDDPEEEKDVQLVWTSRILKGLHRRYYRQEMHSRRSVPELLAQMRSQVLRDSTLVLSGLVPMHKKSIDHNKARPPIVRYVQSLGAELVEKVEVGVTHVVAAKDGTDKCLLARKIPGCVLVSASWLVECYWSMTRRDVKPHLLGGDDAGAAPSSKATTTAMAMNKQPLQESKVDNSNNSPGASDTSSLGSQDDDDDLAASLEDEMMNS